MSELYMCEDERKQLNEQVNSNAQNASALSGQKIYDVVIIGAGLSGLSAGYYLKKEYKDLSILIIEAKDRVGGRTQSVEIKCSKDGTKKKWDVGGQWVCDSQTYLTKLLEELNIKRYKQYNTGSLVIETEGTLVTSTTKLLHNTFEGVLDLNVVKTKMNLIAENINTTDPYLNRELAVKLDKLTFKQYLEKLSGNGKFYSLINAFTRNLCALEASQINALFANMFIKSCGGQLESLLTAEGDCVRGGTQQISEKLFVNILAGNEKSKAVLDCPVKRIVQRKDHVEIVTVNKSTNKLESYYGRKVVSSIPPNQYAFIEFEPELPLTKRNLLNYLKPGNYIKCIVTYASAFWRSKGLAGYALSDGTVYTDSSKTGISHGPVSEVFDGSSDGNEPALVCFCAGQPAIDWAGQTAEIRRNEIVQCLIRFFGPEAGDYIDFYEKNWIQEPYNGGCPTFNVVSPDVMQDYNRATREPFLRTHFCGTESATQWQGYMDGAVESGLRVANELISDLRENNFERIYDYKKTNVKISNL